MVSVEAKESTWLTINESKKVRTTVVVDMMPDILTCCLSVRRGSSNR